MGPGHDDYVLPIAKKALEQAQVVIGGKRHIEPFKNTDKILIPFEGNFVKLPDIIREHSKQYDVVVAVSGDTGFYSLLPYIKKHFEIAEFEVITGIGSLQYMYSRISKAHQKAFLGSVHGRELEYLSLIDDYETVGLLTDDKNSPNSIAQSFCDAGKTDVYMYVGERLSYDDEKITQGLVTQIKDMKFDVLGVVVLMANDVAK